MGCTLRMKGSMYVESICGIDRRCNRTRFEQEMDRRPVSSCGSPQYEMYLYWAYVTRPPELKY